MCQKLARQFEAAQQKKSIRGSAIPTLEPDVQLEPGQSAADLDFRRHHHACRVGSGELGSTVKREQVKPGVLAQLPAADWLPEFQHGKRWTSSELRPQTLCGFAPGTAISILPVIAVYAAIVKELGRPLAWPARFRPCDLLGGRFRPLRQRRPVGRHRPALRADAFDGRALRTL